MFPKLFLFHSLSDIHSSLGKEYVSCNEFMPEAFIRIDTKRTDTTCDIKHTSTLTKHVPNTDKYNIKEDITPTQNRLAYSILSQSDILHKHEQKVRTLE